MGSRSILREVPVFLSLTLRDATRFVVSLGRVSTRRKSLLLDLQVISVHYWGLRGSAVLRRGDTLLLSLLDPGALPLLLFFHAKKHTSG